MTQQQSFGPPWTILKLLNWTKQYFEKQGLSQSRLEAEYLLSHALGLDRVMLYANFDKPLEQDELGAYRALVKRRASHEPMAYITGSRGFMTIELKTDARALIPRPDTETLVEAALELMDKEEAVHFIDVGTGSGAIALSILAQRASATAIATDISKEALSLAQDNARALGLEDRVEFLEMDVLDDLDSALKVDFILSNPPYIGTRERDSLPSTVLAFEPEMALFSGEDGLDIIKRLVPKARHHLKGGGRLMCEIGHEQGAVVSTIFQNQGFSEVEVIVDINKKDRVVSGINP